MAKDNEIRVEGHQTSPAVFDQIQQAGYSEQPIDASKIRNLGRGMPKSIANNTTYIASASGIVIAQATASSSVDIIGYCDHKPTPTTILNRETHSSTGTHSPSIIIPVAKGQYYRVSSITGIQIGYFIPLVR